MPNFVTVDSYPEQEAYWETLAHNRAIENERATITQYTRDLSYATYNLRYLKTYGGFNPEQFNTQYDAVAWQENQVQYLENKLAIAEYRQWCLLHNFDYTAPSLYE